MLPMNKLYRRLRLEYLKLLRTPGAPSKVARGFSVGLFVEFITLPTLGAAFILLFPLSYLFRGSVPASLIGFVFGKVILPPFLLLNFNLGRLLLGQRTAETVTGGFTFSFVKAHWLAFLLGSTVTGIVVAAVGFIAVYWLLTTYRRNRLRRRRVRSGAPGSVTIPENEGK